MTLLTLVELRAEVSTFLLIQVLYLIAIACCFAVAIGASVWFLFFMKDEEEG